MYHSQLVKLTSKAPVLIKVLEEPKESSIADKPPSVLIQLPDRTRHKLSLENQDCVDYFEGLKGTAVLTRAEGSDRDDDCRMVWIEHPEGPAKVNKPPVTGKPRPKPAAAAPDSSGDEPGEADPPNLADISPRPVSGQTKPPKPPPEDPKKALGRGKSVVLRHVNSIKYIVAAMWKVRRELERELPGGFKMTDDQFQGLTSTVCIKSSDRGVQLDFPWEYMSVEPKVEEPASDEPASAYEQGEA